jgi:hypothetical protein
VSIPMSRTFNSLLLELFALLALPALEKSSGSR